MDKGHNTEEERERARMRGCRKGKSSPPRRRRERAIRGRSFYAMMLPKRAIIEGHQEKDKEKNAEIEDRPSCGSNRKGLEKLEPLRLRPRQVCLCREVWGAYIPINCEQLSRR